MKTTTTIKEIARIARVDKSTVSRALNNSPLINIKTKKKVLDIASELDYFPHSLARGLISHKSETIGLIFPELSFLKNPFYTDLLRGFESVSTSNNYNMLITSFLSEKDNFPFHLIRSRKIDGLLIVCSPYSLRTFPELKHKEFPFILVNHEAEDETGCSVTSNDYQGGLMGIDHLISLGHTRIGIITGNLRCFAFSQRVQGCKTALKMRKIPLNEKLIQTGNLEEGRQSGRECMSRLLDLPFPPTAIFALSYDLAMGAVQEIKYRRLHIPGDISFLGYDIPEEDLNQGLPLSTILQNPFQIGCVSCHMLLDLCRDNTIPDNHKDIPVELAVRSTSSRKTWT